MLRRQTKKRKLSHTNFKSTYGRQFRKPRLSRPLRRPDILGAPAKLHCVIPFSTGSGGGNFTVLNYYNPEFIDLTNAFPGWPDWQAVYQEYKPTGIRIQYIPTQPNVTSLTNGVSLIAQDLDDITNPATSQEMFDKDNCRPWNVLENQDWYFPIPKATSVRTDVSVSAATLNAQNGWVRTATASVSAVSNSTGAIKIYAQNMANSVHYGNLYITLYVKFRGQG